MLLFKMLGVCFTAGALSLVLKKEQAAYGFLVSAAAALILLGSTFQQLTELVHLIGQMNTVLQEENLQCLLKLLGIALVSQLSTDFCREAGMQAAATTAELAGRVFAMLQCVPLLQSLVRSFLSFLG